MVNHQLNQRQLVATLRRGSVTTGCQPRVACQPSHKACHSQDKQKTECGLPIPRQRDVFRGCLTPVYAEKGACILLQPKADRCEVNLKRAVVACVWSVTMCGQDSYDHCECV